MPAERVRGRTTAIVARRPRARRAGARFALVRLAWRRVAAIAAAAFVAVVGAFTLFDLARGNSPVSKRGTTFFTPSREPPSDRPLDDPAPVPVEQRADSPPAPPPPATETQPGPD